MNSARKLCSLLTIPSALALVLAFAPAAAAAPAPDAAAQYVVTGPGTAQQRTEVARTGAAIDDVRTGELSVTAIPAEVRAIRRLGYSVRSAPSAAPAPVETKAATSYHTYAEMRQNVDSVVAAYPQIARQFVAGRSYQGRDIVGVKISDNVAVDENEPEVLIIANIHARERLTAEQALDYIGQLTSGYAGNSRIRNLVNGREIYIMPMVNPDGQVYDMTSDTSAGRMWRKNRQPNSTSTGTDLNRNFAYRWGCCGGSSGSGSSQTYRGTRAESAPETKVIADFVRSRVVGGRQQIKMFLDVHSEAELVLWPFGYTYNNTVPGTMTADDELAHRTIGRELASTNGFTPEQSSDLYITDGTTIDWTWGQYRIFSYTFELGGGSFYPPPSAIDREVQRSREALLRLTDYADCPYRAIGKQAQYCAA
ncbi:M14 family metallopeptidase [Actinomadura livida]|uniref:Zinc carboxypeptidase n=1 Tax=Actinomadura livida TaxID=79909 RepID=A0A7W7N0L0_9ACTN|nr:MULTISPECIES: M14 family metallopeptidase [Actinomadura]MBB4777199.1 murein tripeptide amidase MpaA [Actinomadura catellatispora]GGU20935.1 carboxypeptidase T [Actinomadura livida]